MRVKQIIVEYESKDEAEDDMKEMLKRGFYWVYYHSDINEFSEPVWVVTYKERWDLCG
jgi:hypothetical protein